MSIRLQSPRPGHPGHPRPRRASSRGRTATTLVPAAARQPTALSIEETDLAGAAIESFTTAVGGRTKLLQTLAVADSGHDKVVNCLLDPAFATWSLRRLCAYAGITVADLFASYKKALFVQAHVDAAHRITSQLPPIVDDVMRRALPLPTTCPRCSGMPTTPGTSPCPLCRGEGTVLTEPDLDRQKLALELGRLTERKAGVMVQQNQIATSGHALSLGAGSLEQLQQAVGDLLFSPQRRRAASPTTVVETTVRDDPRPDLPVPREEPDDPDPPSDDPEDDEDDDAPLQT
jgi:hypothetical protein